MAASSKQDIGQFLSKVMSIEEVLVDTVIEMTREKRSKIEEILAESETHARLSDKNSDYYNDDILIIASDFCRECVQKYGLQIIKSDEAIDEEKD